jgi:hypothetical protein
LPEVSTKYVPANVNVTVGDCNIYVCKVASCTIDRDDNFINDRKTSYGPQMNCKMWRGNMDTLGYSVLHVHIFQTWIIVKLIVFVKLRKKTLVCDQVEDVYDVSCYSG